MVRHDGAMTEVPGDPQHPRSPGRQARGWLFLLVAAGVLCQGALNLVRPITSYKLLALGSDGFTVGLVTAAYAVLPLLLALALARLTDRRPRLVRLVQT